VAKIVPSSRFTVAFIWYVPGLSLLLGTRESLNSLEKVGNNDEIVTGVVAFES